MPRQRSNDLAETGFPDPAHDHGACRESGLQAARALCRARGARLTPDRLQVLEILLREHAAVGAYDIVESMDWGGRRPASSVVYRALEFLAEQGLVHRLHCRNAFVACVDPASRHGAQFLICTGCLTVAELADTGIEARLVEAARSAGFRVQRSVIEVEGLCPHCIEAGATA